MKLCILLPVCWALLCSVSIGAAETLHPVMQDGKWGYIDRGGKVVIEARFDGAEHFSEGLAAVKAGYGRFARHGFIDGKGEIVIPCTFLEVRGFSDGLAAVSPEKDKWGYVDKSGEVVIPAEYWSSSDFREGRAVVRLNVAEREEALTCIDKTGKELVRKQFRSNGDGYSSFAYMDETGKLMESALDCLVFQEGLALFRSDEEYGGLGYVDREGKVVIAPTFGGGRDFSEGLAAVLFPLEPYVSYKWGFVDKTGKTVIKPEFDEAESFSDGLALVYREIPYSDRESVELAHGEEWRRERDYYFIDKAGKVILSLPYDRVESFRDGLARVWRISPTIGGEPGYIDKTGEFVWEGDKLPEIADKEQIGPQ